MKIKVEVNWREYATFVSQGQQRFTIQEGTKADCQWMAMMFRKALKNHDAEVIEKYFKGDAR
jgi:vacuolar-type H+-ATPase subunit B/Vma2